MTMNTEETILLSLLERLDRGEDIGAIRQTLAPEDMRVFDDLLLIRESITESAKPSPHILTHILETISSDVTAPAHDRLIIPEGRTPQGVHPFFSSFISAFSSMKRFALGGAIAAVVLAFGLFAWLVQGPSQTGGQGDLAEETFADDMTELAFLERDASELEEGLFALSDLSEDGSNVSTSSDDPDRSGDLNQTSSDMNQEFQQIEQDFQEIDELNSDQSDVENDIDSLS